jgi:hypothetical protein
MKDSDQHPTSNQNTILKSMSDFYFTDICTSDLCHFFSSNSLICVDFQILKLASNPQIYGLFSLSQMMSLTYTIALTNKLAIDRRIRKGSQFENTLKSGRDLR